MIERYAALLELEPGSDEGAYLFGSNGAIDRPFEMSGFTQAVRRAFKKHSPSKQEISPKVLRSSFITWLRDSTDCPSILKAAAAAQKHSEQRQGSDSYDAERDTRLVKAAVPSLASYSCIEPHNLNPHPRPHPHLYPHRSTSTLSMRSSSSLRLRLARAATHLRPSPHQSLRKRNRPEIQL